MDRIHIHRLAERIWADIRTHGDSLDSEYYTGRIADAIAEAVHDVEHELQLVDAKYRECNRAMTAFRLVVHEAVKGSNIGTRDVLAAAKKVGGKRKCKSAK